MDYHTHYYRDQWSILLRHIEQHVYDCQYGEVEEKNLVTLFQHFMILMKLVSHEIHEYEDNLERAYTATYLDCADIMFTFFSQKCEEQLGEEQTRTLITNTISLNPFLFPLVLN